MIIEACEFCKYYKEGDCIRFPPQLFVFHESTHPYVFFPKVEKNWVCGEFKKK